ncbi:GNAT family N-acetyltransferase [Haliea sp. E1-2-M8]|uniref:GNAT family N-acetyltransferase n=1 Tax=Haliea sp. E1-2-M8 TaxID=3064706 RepID=UPI00351C2DC9
MVAGGPPACRQPGPGLPGHPRPALSCAHVPRAIDEYDSAVLLVEQRDERVIGFVSGAHSMGPIYRQMLRHWLRLIPSLFPSLLNPRRVWRILEILGYSGRGTSLAELPAYELLSIAVDPSSRGRGVSELLYKGLVSHCREHRIPAFKLVVGEGLAPAHRFYQRMGAEVAGETEVHRGEKSVVYVQQVGRF